MRCSRRRCVKPCVSIVPPPALIVMPRLLLMSKFPPNCSVPPSSVILPAVKVAGAVPKLASAVATIAPPLIVGRRVRVCSGKRQRAGPSFRKRAAANRPGDRGIIAIRINHAAARPHHHLPVGRQCDVVRIEPQRGAVIDLNIRRRRTRQSRRATHWQSPARLR